MEIKPLPVSSEYPPDFSEAYDKCLWRFAVNAAPQLYELYSKYAITPSTSLLDLCCGSGQLCDFFLEKGFSTTGVDLSEKMIEIATRNTDIKYTKNAKWILSDIKLLDLKESFDLVVSTFSALNLLGSIDELTLVLQLAYKHLKNSGLLFFDLTTEVGATSHNNTFFKDTEDYTIILNGFYNPLILKEKAFLNFLGFFKERDVYKRFEHCQVETIFKIASVVEILDCIGFCEVTFFIYGITHTETVQEPEAFPNVIIKARKV